MYLRFYLRKGLVLLPTTRIVENNSGYWMGEPIEAVLASDTAELRAAFARMAARANPVIARGKAGAPILPRYAGVKSWSAFERGLSTWNIADRNGTLQIAGYRRQASGGWEPDPDQIKRLPAGSGIKDAIECAIAIVQAKARE